MDADHCERCGAASAALHALHRYRNEPDEEYRIEHVCDGCMTNTEKAVVPGAADPTGMLGYPEVQAFILAVSDGLNKLADTQRANRRIIDETNDQLTGIDRQLDRIEERVRAWAAQRRWP